jgi:serine/threonine protein kinase
MSAMDITAEELDLFDGIILGEVEGVKELIWKETEYGNFLRVDERNREEGELVLPARLTPVRAIGQGAHGTVIRVHDEERNDTFAMKIIRDWTRDRSSIRRTVREVRSLKHLESHSNIVQLREVIHSNNDRGDDVYLLLEHAKTDLLHVLHSNVRIDEHWIARVLFQVICAVKFIHSSGIVHRDLKPSNVLLTDDFNVKICDFGLSISSTLITDEKFDDNSDQAITRWYRAPEVMLSKNYNHKVDTWSIGCILGEMLTKKPLFKGRTCMDQLDKILEIIGTPQPTCEDESCKLFRNMKKYPGKAWDELIPNASEESLNLLSKLLVFDPKQRMSLDETLKHEFFRHVYDTELVRLSNNAIDILDTEFEHILTADTTALKEVMN